MTDQPLTDRIADLKEQRSAAILAQLPTTWEGVPFEQQGVLMKRAELADEVLALDAQIHAARAEQLLARVDDPDDAFDAAALDATIQELRRQHPPAAAVLAAARDGRTA